MLHEKSGKRGTRNRGSSIEHGGTSAIYIFMAQLALFNEGVRDHFPICGNFCEVLLVAGGFILFSLHMTMVWDLARGAGILAPSNAIDVCVSKHQSALIGGDGDSQLHRRAEGPRT